MSAPLEPSESVLASASSGLRRSLTAPRITLLVVAMAAPLGSMVGNVPIGILLGNGAGLPAMFLIAGLLIACVAVGYIALSRESGEAGGFAALIRVGLGARVGRGAAYATGLAYLAGTLALATGTGYFSSITFASYGLDLPWYVWSGLAMLLVFALGRRGADLSSQVLFLLMIGEFVLLAVLDVAILIQHGFAALPWEVFSPEMVFSGSLGPALMVGFTSYIGIESAIIYTREAKDPARAIPRATFSAVAVIAAFYVISSWLFIGSVGVDSVVGAALDSEGALVFGIAAANGGDILVVLLQIFFCLSLLATLVALHNATVRYLHALAERGEMPRALAAVHHRHGSPHRSSDVTVVAMTAVLGVFAVLGVNPYVGLGTSLTGLFTIGVIGIQAIVSVAVVVHFRRKRDPRLFTTVVAPVVGGLGIAAVTVIIAVNYSVLTGTDALVANLLPLLFVGVFLVGVFARPVRADAAPSDGEIAPAAQAA